MIARAALIVAAMDTKGDQALYLEACFREVDVPVLTIDAGVMGETPFPVTVSREDVAGAGGMTLAEVRGLGDEAKAIGVMAQGAAGCARALYGDGRIGGIIGIGGSMGTTLGTTVMKSFPVGFPKVMVSTMASSNTRAFVGSKDIMMIYSICDISGINRVLEKVLRNGALALAGMIKNARPFSARTAAVLALSTLGTTEACSQRVRRAFEEKGYEVLVFHAQGSGGAAMEEMIREEELAGVIDLSISEIADHLYGGDYDAGPDRGTSALQKGIPTVIVPGNIDFMGAGPFPITRKRFPGRLLHAHNPAITVVRTTKEEVAGIATTLARYCNDAKGPVACLVPTGGFSAFDRKGGPFYDPDASQLFAMTLKAGLSPSIPLQILPHHINDSQFAESIIGAMEGLLQDPLRNTFLI